jgi:hypothetical protein
MVFLPKLTSKALISLHIWAAVSSYEVLGDFGEHAQHYKVQKLILRLAIFGLLPYRADPIPIGLYWYLPIPQQPRTKYGRSSLFWSLAH